MTNTTKTTAKSQPRSGAAPAPVGLPCRGCLPDCKNRPICQGKPWRTLGTAQGSASTQTEGQS